eukprot:jgi/Psemu1/285910/fgenesh1_pg.108_\
MLKGRCEDLDGHIFDIGPMQATKCMKTHKELIEYGKRTYGADVCQAINKTKCIKDKIKKDEPKDPGGKNLSKIKLVIMEKEKARRYIIRPMKYTVAMDKQFEPKRGSMEDLGVTPNYVTNDEHVPEMERYIQTIKERVRGVQCTLPFRKLPAKITIKLVASQVFWWNSVPKPSGISATMSPLTIITGMSIDYGKHMRLQFGEYSQTHEARDNDTANKRTAGAITLRPSGNYQGG